MESVVGSIQDLLQHIDKKMDKIEDKVGRLDGRLDDVDVNLARQEGHLSEYFRKIDTLEERLQPVEDRVKHVEGIFKFFTAITIVCGALLALVKMSQL